MKRSLLLAALLTVLCLGLSVVLLSTAGCSTLSNLHILNPSYSLVDVAPHVNLSIPPSMDFDLTVGVDNPNPVGLRLDGLDFALFVNDNRIANGTSFDRVNIPARGIGNVRLRTHVTYDNLKSIYREVVDMVQGNRARYAIEGNATYDTPVGRMTLPVTIQR
jgi:LEA14-like dessication related protein